MSRKLQFSILCGLLIESVFIYIMYYINGGEPFSQVTYLMVTINNPCFVLIFYYLSKKMLKLPNFHSLHLASNIYIYLLFAKMFGRFISVFVFTQSADVYNYMLDILSIMTSQVLGLIIYLTALYILKNSVFVVRLPGKPKARVSASEIISTVILVCASYTLSVCIPVFFNEQPMAYFLLAILFAFLFLLAILVNATLSAISRLAEKDSYIRSLSNANDKFKLIKHDFYNILCTYSGYIQIGDIDKLKKYHEKLLNTSIEAGDLLDLNRRMAENPTMISLLINKLEQARNTHVFMHVSLLCSVETVVMDNLNLCRAMACMLDNAIEAAAKSKERRVNLLIEKTRRGNRRIIITNSVNNRVDTDKIGRFGYTTKEGHTGLGLAEARGIFEEPGCIFNVSCTDNEFTIYIETPYVPYLQTVARASADV
ncbi:MAG: GHKL domain-containing protein [Clostridiales bacterium]|nr:GHKL domain-containing protein [Clostridiales bacterium]